MTRLGQLAGFGLGSAVVGSVTLPRGSASVVCEVCSRCHGEGFKSAVLIAGKWVGGDVTLCHRCRGSGGLTFALFRDQQEALAGRIITSSKSRKRAGTLRS